MEKHLMEISYQHFSKLKKGVSKRRNTTQQKIQRHIFWTPTLNQRFCFKQKKPFIYINPPRPKKNPTNQNWPSKQPNGWPDRRWLPRWIGEGASTKSFKFNLAWSTMLLLAGHLRAAPGRLDVGFGWRFSFFRITLPKTKSLPLKRAHFKRKWSSSSNQPFNFQVGTVGFREGIVLTQETTPTPKPTPAALHTQRKGWCQMMFHVFS